MSNIEPKRKLMNYFKLTPPSEISVNKEDIFYREKYQEIINYLKLLLTDSKDLEIYNYVNPKGLLLVNVQPGTDLLNYLKLIAANYYIPFIQLNKSFIYESPQEFLNSFPEVLQSASLIGAQEEQKFDEEDKKGAKNNEREQKKRILVINEDNRVDGLLESGSLLQKFLEYYQGFNKTSNFLDNNIILIWVNHDYSAVEENTDLVFKIFDLLIKIPRINKNNREQILRAFSEKNPTVVFDIEQIIDHTDSWEVEDIKQLMKISVLKQYLRSELNAQSNEITDIIIDLIETGEMLPSSLFKTIKRRKSKEKIEGINQKLKFDEFKISDQSSISNISKKTDSIINQIKREEYSEFMLNQLYEDAASHNYNELVIILDKLKNNEPIEQNDRNLLAKYPFILNDPPSRAQITMEKAKKRIDLMKKAFKKEI
ncbi:MAG: hypothetical protein GF317_25115 [Candidatus Lokiarchaeota archaeon]|nr:hypothetical protein [Candidatus Lokiarchaeota archaeon]MBD3202640.1 hypothetical protein [Candidatus Lokiarchaeota archaeon]